VTTGPIRCDHGFVPESRAEAAEAKVERLREALDTLWFELDAGTRDSARYAFRHLHADVIAELERARS
jgi:hypothetical protein